MIGAGGGRALAQSADPHFFAESRVIVGDWTFVPIYHIDAQQTAVVNGLFVYADESTRTGNNLSAVWYKKGATGWSASSWMTLDLQEAIKSVRIEENIQNDLWEEFFAGPFEGEPESPKEFSDGVLVGDPAEGIVTSVLDPQPLLSFLVTVGYAAANVPVIGEESCDREEILNNIALRLSEDIALGDDTIASLPTELCAGPPRGPRPPKPPRPATAPPWSVIPINGPLPGTGWVTGDWPTTGTPTRPDWYCFRTVGGQSCFCSRLQRWGRWETRNGTVRWREVFETESCNANLAATCPAGGPPPANAGCSSRYGG
jgi:hypothetical protein